MSQDLRAGDDDLTGLAERRYDLIELLSRGMLGRFTIPLYTLGILRPIQRSRVGVRRGGTS